MCRGPIPTVVYGGKEFSTIAIPLIQENKKEFSKYMKFTDVLRWFALPYLVFDSGLNWDKICSKANTKINKLIFVRIRDRPGEINPLDI